MTGQFSVGFIMIKSKHTRFFTLLETDLKQTHTLAKHIIPNPDYLCSTTEM